VIVMLPSIVIITGSRARPFVFADDAQGAGRRHDLVFTYRVLVTLAVLRLRLPHAALAAMLGVDRSTATRAVHEIRPLLASSAGPAGGSTCPRPSRRSGPWYPTAPALHAAASAVVRADLDGAGGTPAIIRRDILETAVTGETRPCRGCEHPRHG
jgi:hypothetical protein